MAETKPAFPKEITLNIDTWSGTTTDGTNGDSLHSEYEAHMQRERQNALAAIKADKPKKRKRTASVLAVLSVVFLVIAAPLGVAGLVAAAACFRSSGKIAKANQEQVAAINAEYDEKIIAGNKKINEILAEWKNAKSIVEKFESDSFPDIVA